MTASDDEREAHRKRRIRRAARGKRKKPVGKKKTASDLKKERYGQFNKG